MSQQLPLGLQLKASARFENFVTGPNREPVMQLQRTANGDGEPFLFCWGGTGCGKTHLLQASCHQAAARNRHTAYMSFRDSAALAPAVLEAWENYDLVCLDDLDAVAGNAAWEEALFHLYNRIRERRGNLFVSACAAPAQLGVALPDLLSRLGWGLVYQLKPLNDEQRLQALQLRARQKGFDMPAETASYMLRRLPRDMPVLFDLLDRLDQASLVAQRKLTVPFVKSVLDI